MNRCVCGGVQRMVRMTTMPIVVRVSGVCVVPSPPCQVSYSYVCMCVQRMMMMMIVRKTATAMRVSGGCVCGWAHLYVCVS